MKSVTLLSAFAVLPLLMGMAKTPPEKKPAMENPASLLVTERTEGPSHWGGGYASSAGETLLIESEEAWAALWKDKLDKEAPAVDFSKYSALAVFLGSRNTGGYGVEFLPPVAKENSVLLQWREKKPAAGGFVIQAFTQPFAIQLYKKTDAPLEVGTR